MTELVTTTYEPGTKQQAFADKFQPDLFVYHQRLVWDAVDKLHFKFWKLPKEERDHFATAVFGRLGPWHYTTSMIAVCHLTANKFWWHFTRAHPHARLLFLGFLAGKIAGEVKSCIDTKLRDSLIDLHAAYLDASKAWDLILDNRYNDEASGVRPESVAAYVACQMSEYACFFDGDVDLELARKWVDGHAPEPPAGQVLPDEGRPARKPVRRPLPV